MTNMTLQSLARQMDMVLFKYNPFEYINRMEVGETRDYMVENTYQSLADKETIESWIDTMQCIVNDDCAAEFIVDEASSILSELECLYNRFNQNDDSNFTLSM